ncbi:hypothetical protein [Streptomyces halobius]|uniref:Uncharacterized protein n=1 Tax=Streptomyces halobius TaxID=2879846 RepID=A0ABY4M6M9_9ACTN|nr:hypothetical protein [Streptomyces halobius]UQA93417.1 hypothetical protein K9S39_17570 [Streptomyces halobius]
MTNAIARLLEPLLRLLLPARGRHRSAGAPPPVYREDVPALAPPRASVRQPELLRGEDSALIRPYVLTPEELQERRSQPLRRRRVLWLATNGIDVDPRWSHTVKVAA